ncbi:MAG: ABC transporter permease [Oscillospiraceae bacterium]|nr:ABC transporter permease [Oscillospiraceae bacterium]
MKKNRFGSRLFMTLIGIFLYAPIAVLIIFSFNASKSRSVWAGFTLDWYTQLFQNERILSAITTTFLVSILSALIATVVGTAAAMGFSAMKRRPRGLFLSINNIPLINADIITGVSLMLLFVFFGGALTALGFRFRLGFGTLLMAHITFNVPYVILSVMPKLRQLDPNLMEAALDLGATPWQSFWKVVLPEIWPGVFNGMLIAFTMSIDDFVISYFTAGSGVSTLAMEIYAMTRKRISPEINAVSTLMFLFVLILLIIINVRQIRQERQERNRRQQIKGSEMPVDEIVSNEIISLLGESEGE